MSQPQPPSETTTTVTIKTMTLPNPYPPIPIKLSTSTSSNDEPPTLDELLSHPALGTHLTTLNHSLSLQNQPNHPFHTKPYHLRSLTLESYNRFGGGRLGFLKLSADVSNDDGEKLPGIMLLRGGSVAMLLVLQAEEDAGEKHVILTVQPRVPAGSLSFTELPAGMIDDSGSFSGAAAKEIQEETGLSISSDELTDLTALAFETEETPAGEYLQRGVYTSPGGQDEFVPVMYCCKKMRREEIESLKGKATGLREEGEKIKLQLCRLEECWRVAGRDGKALAAMALYDGLKREGKI